MTYYENSKQSNSYVLPIDYGMEKTYGYNNFGKCPQNLPNPCDSKCQRGCRGPAGATGQVGPEGPAGENGNGAIIPFASGTVPAVLTTVLGGLLNTGTIVGFGGAIADVGGLGGAIDITLLGNLALDLPRDGILDAVSALIQTSVYDIINSLRK